MFKRILIANRGEIAVRVAQSVQEMGMRAVAVYSDPDRASLHVRCADEAYPLLGTTAGETYLDIEKIIEIARSHGVDAIHPGYGFLSENASFAMACGDAGITFIGPTPDVIRSMGDKIVAKKTMTDAGVPVVPGWSMDAGDAGPDAKTLAREAEQIGFPVLIKAAAGGGGKGMRVVESAQAFVPALEAAQREAGAAFGDSRVFLEKYVTRPRHIEFQIFGDAHGNVVHLFERECSIQRRHQKIIEESPSPALTPEIREQMGAAAVEAARAIGYTNAGTVEFMLDENGAFYFLEVNTRLQVEHPVTEMVTGWDLVRAQILVASGERLPFAQEELEQTGSSIECRIYAEDAARNFMPSTGRIEHYVPPIGAGVRVDSGVTAKSEVTVHYDPMLAKLITWDRDRHRSLDKMTWALRRFVALGVTTNIEFLQAVIGHPEFRAGRLHTHFLDAHGLLGPDAATPLHVCGGNGDHAESHEAALIAAAFASRSLSHGNHDDSPPADGDGSQHPSPWETAHAWRVV